MSLTSRGESFLVEDDTLLRREEPRRRLGTGQMEEQDHVDSSLSPSSPSSTSTRTPPTSNTKRSAIRQNVFDDEHPEFRDLRKEQPHEEQLQGQQLQQQEQELRQLVLKMVRTPVGSAARHAQAREHYRVHRGNEIAGSRGNNHGILRPAYGLGSEILNFPRSSDDEDEDEHGERAIAKMTNKQWSSESRHQEVLAAASSLFVSGEKDEALRSSSSRVDKRPTTTAPASALLSSPTKNSSGPSYAVAITFKIVLKTQAGLTQAKNSHFPTGATQSAMVDNIARDANTELKEQPVIAAKLAPTIYKDEKTKLVPKGNSSMGNFSNDTGAISDDDDYVASYEAAAAAEAASHTNSTKILLMGIAAVIGFVGLVYYLNLNDYDVSAGEREEEDERRKKEYREKMQHVNTTAKREKKEKKKRKSSSDDSSSDDEDSDEESSDANEMSSEMDPHSESNASPSSSAVDESSSAAESGSSNAGVPVSARGKEKPKGQKEKENDKKPLPEGEATGPVGSSMMIGGGGSMIGGAGGNMMGGGGEGGPKGSMITGAGATSMVGGSSSIASGGSAIGGGGIIGTLV
ncbi:unnamed protein product, partial [Amoebophrya sp. A25]|eukprot:GSA25T00014438001.1